MNYVIVTEFLKYLVERVHPVISLFLTGRYVTRYICNTTIFFDPSVWLIYSSSSTSTIVLHSMSHNKCLLHFECHSLCRQSQRQRAWVGTYQQTTSHHSHWNQGLAFCERDKWRFFCFLKTQVSQTGSLAVYLRNSSTCLKKEKKKDSRLWLNRKRMQLTVCQVHLPSQRQWDLWALLSGCIQMWNLERKRYTHSDRVIKETSTLHWGDNNKIFNNKYKLREPFIQSTQY